MEALGDAPKLHTLLAECDARAELQGGSTERRERGLQVMELLASDESSFLEPDQCEVLAFCTKDTPETAVFVRPFAMRLGDGPWRSLESNLVREKVFYSSGDVIIFHGRERLRQPKRGEVGLWRVAQNEPASPTHRTNFHAVAEVATVYEVRTVPFASVDYDGVREYIKHQAEVGGAGFNKTTLFLLRDGLIVGCPTGKDLTKDEGFDAGLPCWDALQAMRVEARLLVPGPLPASGVYECDSLASSIRKLLARDQLTPTRWSKAQVRELLELISSGKARLDAARQERLLKELELIEQHTGAKDALLDLIMAHPKLERLVEVRVQERVNALVNEKEELQRVVGGLQEEKQRLSEQNKQIESEQRAIAPAVSKAIRRSFDKARKEGIEALAQAEVFKAIMEATESREGDRSLPPARRLPAANEPLVRPPKRPATAPMSDVLRTLGVPPRSAKAFQLVGDVAYKSGLVLVVDGTASRLAAEDWLTIAPGTQRVIECKIGMTDDASVRGVLTEAPSAIAVLDVNMSALDAFAMPVIDAVQERIAGRASVMEGTLVVMSLSRGIAALPLASDLASISLNVNLDLVPDFLSERDASTQLEELMHEDAQDTWFARLWKPAARRVLESLRELQTEQLALVLSALGSSHV